MESWPLNWIRLILWCKGNTLRFFKLVHLVWIRLKLWRKGLFTLSIIHPRKRRWRTLRIWNWVCLFLSRKTLWRKRKTLKFFKWLHLVWIRLKLWRKELVTLIIIEPWLRRKYRKWTRVCLVLKRKTLWRKGVFFRNWPKRWRKWRLHIPVCLIWTRNRKKYTVVTLRLSKWLRHLSLVLRSWSVH